MHYINKKGQLINRLLFIEEFKNQKKDNVNIKRVLNDKFTDLKLGPVFKKMTFVTDSGSNIVKALQENGNKRLPCVNHTVNNCLKYGFSENHLMSANIINLIKNSKQIVTTFKRTGIMKKLKKSLKQSNITRFNTYYIMLKSIHEQIDEVNLLIATMFVDSVEAQENIELDGNDSSNYETVSDDEVEISDSATEDEENDHNPITKIDTRLLTDIVNFLEVFEEGMKDLEGEKKVTIHKVLPWKHIFLNECEVSVIDSEDMLLLKRNVRKFIDQKMKLDPLHSVATFLCPKFKQLSMLTTAAKNQVKQQIKEMLASFPENIDNQVSDVNPPLPKRSRLDVFYEKNSLPDPIEAEIDLYLGSTTLPNDADLLEWWKIHEEIYPRLNWLATQVLVIPASSSSSERVFSVGRRVLEERRTALKSDVFGHILFLNSNLYNNV